MNADTTIRRSASAGAAKLSAVIVGTSTGKNLKMGDASFAVAQN